MYCVRGATTVLEDNKENVIKETRILLEEIILKNDIKIKDIISIIFTATKDISSVYPAVAARELEITSAGLICMQEMYVEGSLSKCIRVLINVNTNKNQNDARHIYLNNAKILRPDITEDFEKNK